MTISILLVLIAIVFGIPIGRAIYRKYEMAGIDERVEEIKDRKEMVNKIQSVEVPTKKETKTRNAKVKKVVRESAELNEDIDVFKSS